MHTTGYTWVAVLQPSPSQSFILLVYNEVKILNCPWKLDAVQDPRYAGADDNDLQRFRTVECMRPWERCRTIHDGHFVARNTFRVAGPLLGWVIQTGHSSPFHGQSYRSTCRVCML
jgi:hypothetical protein